jgi:hypothetical protein
MKPHRPRCDCGGWKTFHLPILMTLHPTGFGTSVSALLHLCESRDHRSSDKLEPSHAAGISAAGWSTIACVLVGLALVPLFIADW